MESDCIFTIPQGQGFQPQAIGLYLKEAFNLWFCSKQRDSMRGGLPSTQDVIAPLRFCACGLQPCPFGTFIREALAREGEPEG